MVPRAERRMDRGVCLPDRRARRGCFVDGPEYLVYGETQDSVRFRVEYLESALEVSDIGDSRSSYSIRRSCPGRRMGGEVLPAAVSPEPTALRTFAELIGRPSAAFHGGRREAEASTSAAAARCRASDPCRVCSDPPFEGRPGRRVRRRPVSGRARSPRCSRRARDRIRVVGCVVARDRRRTPPFRSRPARALEAPGQSSRATPRAARGGTPADGVGQMAARSGLAASRRGSPPERSRG